MVHYRSGRSIEITKVNSWTDKQRSLIRVPSSPSRSSPFTFTWDLIRPANPDKTSGSSRTSWCPGDKAKILQPQTQTDRVPRDLLPAGESKGRPSTVTRESKIRIKIAARESSGDSRNGGFTYKWSETVNQISLQNL